MDWKEYEIEASKFDKVPYANQFEQFEHGFLGYLSEYDELAAAIESNNVGNIKEELGDMCWYISCLSRLTKTEPEVKVSNITIGFIANVAKRWKYGNKPPSEPQINAIANEIFAGVMLVAKHYNLELSDILTANIAKLNLRTQNASKAYTEVVDESARDRVAEAKIME